MKKGLWTPGATEQNPCSKTIWKILNKKTSTTNKDKVFSGKASLSPPPHPPHPTPRIGDCVQTKKRKKYLHLKNMKTEKQRGEYEIYTTKPLIVGQVLCVA